MSRGNCIIVTADPKGNFLEGYIGGSQTPKPGTVMQIDASVALKSGRHTWVAFSRDADGDRPKGPFAILLEDKKVGGLATDAYVAGALVRMYCPLPGDELNLLFYNQAGTADDIALGDLLIVKNAVGKVFKSTGSVECEVAVALEAIVDPTADQLLWSMWSGQ